MKIIFTYPKRFKNITIQRQAGQLLDVLGVLFGAFVILLRQPKWQRKFLKLHSKSQKYSFFIYFALKQK